MGIPQISGTVIVSIIATGVLLNMAGQGYLGETVKKGAQFVTEGYGV